MNWFEQVKNNVLMALPNMPNEYIERSIQNAAAQFFQQTHLLKDEYYFTGGCLVPDYVVDLPEGRQLVQAVAVYSTSTSNNAASLLDPSWCAVSPALARTQRGWYLDMTGANLTLSITPVSRAEVRYCMTYSWAPTTATCELPVHLTGKYLDALTDGTLYRLYLLPTDFDTASPALARVHGSQFQAAIRDARVHESQNHTAAHLVMQGAGFL